MIEKPRVAIVGAGNLATALAISLHRARYPVVAVISRPRAASVENARGLARRVGARALSSPRPSLDADLVWFCVPDGKIAGAALAFGEKVAWNGKVAIHSSGVLTSDALGVLSGHGAAVASVHPLMTFVRGAKPSLAGVPFAIEGDASALRVARRVIKDLGASAHPIRKKDKAAYHAWGTFASPLLTALLATTEQVAATAGVNRTEARRRMTPILMQTLANYSALGAAEGFSGPIIRGDADTVRRHLHVLRRQPAAREVYLALARAALQYLPMKNPAKNKNAIRKILAASPD